MGSIIQISEKFKTQESPLAATFKKLVSVFNQHIRNKRYAEEDPGGNFEHWAETIKCSAGDSVTEKLAEQMTFGNDDKKTATVILSRKPDLASSKTIFRIPFDFACDGIKDEEQIVFALTQMRSKTGGKLFFKHGDYFIDTQIKLDLTAATNDVNFLFEGEPGAIIYNRTKPENAPFAMMKIDLKSYKNQSISLTFRNLLFRNVNFRDMFEFVEYDAQTPINIIFEDCIFELRAETKYLYPSSVKLSDIGSGADPTGHEPASIVIRNSNPTQKGNIVVNIDRCYFGKFIDWNVMQLGEFWWSGTVDAHCQNWGFLYILNAKEININQSYFAEHSLVNKYQYYNKVYTYIMPLSTSWWVVTYPMIILKNTNLRLQNSRFYTGGTCVFQTSDLGLSVTEIYNNYFWIDHMGGTMPGYIQSIFSVLKLLNCVGNVKNNIALGETDKSYWLPGAGYGRTILFAHDNSQSAPNYAFNASVFGGSQKYGLDISLYGSTGTPFYKYYFSNRYEDDNPYGNAWQHALIQRYIMHAPNDAPSGAPNGGRQDPR